MKIETLFSKKQVFSFEIFPPKKDSSIDTIYSTLDGLGELKPDFISVTFGAGGSVANNKTCEIASVIKEKYGIESAAHLTCINFNKEEVTRVLDDLEEKGIENILALRGDKNPDIEPKNDFAHASDLISFINSGNHNFDIAGACYPEGHPNSQTIDEDIDNLKIKVNAGARHLISQLFLDNSMFYDFMDKARAKGINVPVEAGIMPANNKKQIERMVTMCGASLPSKFAKMLNKYEYNPEARRDAGIAYAVDQIADLLSQNVDGVHLYTMNNPYIAKKITDSVSSLITYKQ
ncbi:MAG: methylenetetrahydrofolate reductase [Firmicutes bacterium]|nr:methylenetetrahydrofolate reductase [NAD(P)H] [Bacillota bacterium]